MEIKSKTKSTGKGGGSTSTAGHTQKRAIVKPAQFNKLTTGKCVLINPAYRRKDEGSILLILKVKVPKADLAQEAWGKERWPKVRDLLIDSTSIQRPLSSVVSTKAAESPELQATATRSPLRWHHPG